MGMFKRLRKAIFGERRARDAAEALYAAAVDAARQPALYAELGAPDTVEGRFEVLSFHVFALMRRLKSGDASARRTSEALADVMFQNMDDSLRELGVGDLQVGRKVRKLAEDFYGRATAYDAALACDDALARAVGRNIFLDEAAPAAPALAQYLRLLVARVDAQPQARVAAGIVQFGA